MQKHVNFWTFFTYLLIVLLIGCDGRPPIKDLPPLLEPDALHAPLLPQVAKLIQPLLATAIVQVAVEAQAALHPWRFAVYLAVRGIPRPQPIDAEW